ncbi:hypothetical protein D1Z90_10135 [Motilimonas pumila]|uniref:Uncharacterized protein n=2 Tax=Motilimonas pumila TaxID=2303987 RepID=A0A418YF85_9GAMM|nr:hypothetical protein D1Z90_10135 [Motilimonas pumila]
MLLTLCLPSLAWAHWGTMECTKLSSEQLQCQVGWSDGSGATNYDVMLYDYDDQLLQQQVSNERSLVQFSVPEGDYYIVFDPGHEFAIEVDGVDIK